MEIPKSHEYVILPEPLEENTAQLTVFPEGNPEQNSQAYALLVRHMKFEEMVELKAKLPEEAKIVGIPQYWSLAVIEGKPRLFIWPAAAENLYARFRYCPAMKEI